MIAGDGLWTVGFDGLGEVRITQNGAHRGASWGKTNRIALTPDSAAPTAHFWISQRHRFVDQVLVSEPGISIMYAR